jgi:8-oxo-dGTP pyrophosphatase MutT (NUDIX family)
MAVKAIKNKAQLVFFIISLLPDFKLALLLNHISNNKVIQNMKEQPEIWERKASKEIADCRVFKVREDLCQRTSNGTEHSFFVVENPDWVNIIAVTEDKQVILIEQFRYGAEEITLEIPGGMVDSIEEPIRAAKRELVEETGYTAREIIPLGKSRPNPAIQNNWIYHFLARNCEKNNDTAFDEHESIITKLVALEDIDRLIETGEITHSLVLAAFYKFRLSQSNKEIKKLYN